jgi:hypothetical protein
MEPQTQYHEAVETPMATVFQNATRPEHTVFRKEGEYWTVSRGGNAFRLKDSRGLGYLAHLLHDPGTRFHVLDLVGGTAGEREADEGNRLARGAEDLDRAGIHIAGLGDAGEMFDEQAKVAYRQRLSELSEELDEAKEQGNVERRAGGAGD